MAPSKSLRSIKAATRLVMSTASIKGVRMILFSRMVMTGEGMPGLMSRTARTASTPCRVESQRS